jgi:hypothetical protein
VKEKRQQRQRKERRQGNFRIREEEHRKSQDNKRKGWYSETVAYTVRTLVLVYGMNNTGNHRVYRREQPRHRVQNNSNIINIRVNTRLARNHEDGRDHQPRQRLRRSFLAPPLLYPSRCVGIRWYKLGKEGRSLEPKIRMKDCHKLLYKRTPVMKHIEREDKYAGPISPKE